MYWIRVDADVADSPKVGALARALGTTRDCSLALLVKFWGWIARHKPDGDLSGVDAKDVAEGARYRGKPARLLSGLVAAGLVDRDRKVHDWHDMNGRALADAERKRKFRQKLREDRTNSVRGRVRGQSADGSRDISGTRPRLTGRDVTGRDKPTTTDKRDAGESADASADAPSSCAMVEFLTAWNALHGKAPTIAKCRDVKGARGRLLTMRLREPDWRRDWAEALRRIADCPFLVGKNDRGWTANVDWFLKPGSVRAILEGKYDNNRAKGAAGGDDPLAHIDFGKNVSGVRKAEGF